MGTNTQPAWERGIAMLTVHV